MLQPRDIRDHLATVFGVERNGVAEIRDQVIVSDGRSQEDLLAITTEKMAEYVGSEESFPRLWELTCAKAKHELNPPVGIITPTITPIEQSHDEEKLIEEKPRKAKAAK